MIHNQLSKYIKVKSGYEIPLKVIRDAITSAIKAKDESLLKILKQKGCAIGFFKFEDEKVNEEDQMRMRIFHFSDETLQENFNDYEFTKTILSVISRKKRYSQFDHLTHFRKNYSNADGKLYKVEFSNDDIVTFCPDKKSVIIKGEEIKWSKLKKDLEKPKSTYYNKYSKQLDHLLFSSEMKSIYVMPIPILSSPSVLLFIHREVIDDFFARGEEGKIAKNKFIKTLIHKVSDALFFHMYNRLLIEFTEDGSGLNLQKQQDKLSLVNEFIKSISHIILPVKYRIDNGVWIDFFNWYDNDTISELHSVSIDLFPERTDKTVKIPFYHKIEFVLPNFIVPFSGKEWKMRAGRETNGAFSYHEYIEQEEKFIVTIQNLYRMIFDYWRTIRESKDFIKRKLEPQLAEVKKLTATFKIDKFTEALTNLNNSVSILAKGEISINNSFYPSQLNGNGISKNSIFTFIYNNKRIDNLTQTNIYCLYDFLSNNGELTRLDSFQYYKNRSEKKIKENNVDKKVMIDDFEAVKKDVIKYEELVKCIGPLDLTDQSSRYTIYTLLGHIQKLNSLIMKLRKTFGIIRSYEFKANVENLKELINELNHLEEFERFRNDPNNSAIFKRDSNSKNFNSVKNEYAKKLRAAIKAIVKKSVIKEEILELFRDCGLINYSTTEADFIINPVRDSLDCFDETPFNNWEFNFLSKKKIF